MPKYESLEALHADLVRRFRPESAADVRMTIQAHLTGEGGGDYHLVVHDGTIRIEPGVHPAPTATVTASVQDWLRVHGGEVNPVTLLMSGRVKFAGSMTDALRLQSLFRDA